MKHRINFARLQKDLEELSAIGRRKDTGIYRTALSDGDMEARAWLAGKIESAGLTLEIDPAANMFGKLNCKPGLASVLTGSHMDTVPGAGHLDGALGVVAGLECLRSLREGGFEGARGLELVNFTDEEGRFGGMPGSQALTGKLTPEDILKATDLQGQRFADVLESRGFTALHVLRAARPRETVAAFVELHIEQGPVLDSEQLDIGIVTGIVGLFKWRVVFAGSANHAGTTPMNLRKDAFMGVAEFALGIEPLLAKHGGAASVATIGQLTLAPGAPNVVPGRAEFSLEVRDIDESTLEQLALAARRELAAVAERRGLMFEFSVLSEMAPVHCDAGVMSAIADAASARGASTRSMPSGAAHDAQQMASLAPTGMIFIPSKDGRSHSPAEWSSWDAIERGADVLMHTLAQLAS